MRVAFLNVVLVVLAAFVLLRGQRLESFWTNYSFHTLMALWVCWVSCPWLGKCHDREPAAQQPAEPDGRSRHGPCERRKARAGPARGLASLNRVSCSTNCCEIRILRVRRSSVASLLSQQRVPSGGI